MLADVLSTKEKFIFYSLTAGWFCSTVVFWIWWFEPRHVGSAIGFGITSLIIAWPMILFGYCFFFLLQMKRVGPDIPVPTGLRVAMVITKAPSEPSSIVRKTLQAALFQGYPHDTWVADEDPSVKALEWYQQHGVKVSCRKYDPAYHNDAWPRRKKCKEGNLTYFYDKYGYDNYDVVVQMDADHVPQENYLQTILKPFTDESVGYVSAPSICDLNIKNSWVARARMQSEGLFHGPIQSGSNTGWVPICIGSHYAVRTKALKEIGGIGPELAEDYSTTLLFNASRWKGVWVYDAHARGEGPNSFADIIVQDYQWARSLTTLFVTLYPRLWKKLNWRQRLQFTFTQMWYGVSACMWLAGILTIIFVLLTGRPLVVMNFLDFLKFALVPFSLVFIIFIITQRKGHMRPTAANFLNWESVLFELARWPWVCIACADALFSIAASRKHTFTVTSKNKGSSEIVPLKIIMPYLLIVSALTLSMVFGKATDKTIGYFVFAGIIALCYTILSFVVLVFHIRETESSSKLKLTAQHAPHFVSSLGLLSIFLVGIIGLKYYNSEAARTTAAVLSSTQVATLMQEYQLSPVEIQSIPLDTGTSTLLSAEPVFSQYTIKPGDTLRHIAFERFGDDTDWIYIERKDNSNPDLISPGEVVFVPNHP